MIHSSDKSLKYRPDIDGLRSIAIISVVLFHANVPFIRGGFVGVDVFFVISGFLIGSLVFREMDEGRFSLKKFYERRAKRILPALFTVVAFCFIPASLLLSGVELKGFAQEVVATLTSLSNVYFGGKGGYLDSAAEFHPLLMTWSLGVEEQFYVFFPLVMFLLIRFGRRYVLSSLAALSLLSFLLSVYTLTLYPTQTFYLLPPRAWELGLGTMLGIYEVLHPFRDNSARPSLSQQVMGFAGTVLLFYGIFAFNGDTPFPGCSALVPTVGAVMLIRARSSWVNTRILSAKPLVAIGLVSYSWYLWHWPLMAFARITMAGVLPVRVGVVIAVLSLGIAFLSYFFVEQPLRKPSSPKTPILSRYAFASLSLGIPAILLILGHGWQQRYPEAHKVDLANLRSSEDPCLVRFRDSQPMRSSLCQSADRVQPIVAVMGDSHAAALAPYLRSAATSQGWQVDDLTKANCPQLGPVTLFLPERRHHDIECATFNQKALDIILSNPNVRMVLLAGAWTSAFPVPDIGQRFVLAGQNPVGLTEAASWTNLEAGLRKTTQLLQSGGKRVLIVVDVPKFQADPVVAARTNTIPIRAALNRLLGGPDLTSGVQPEKLGFPEVNEHAKTVITRVANETGATIVDLPETLCKESRCRFELNDSPFYVDSWHLSADGATYALQNAKAFQSAWAEEKAKLNQPTSPSTFEARSAPDAGARSAQGSGIPVTSGEHWKRVEGQNRSQPSVKNPS